MDEDGSFLGDPGGRLGAGLIFVVPKALAATLRWEVMGFLVLAVKMRCRELLLLLRRR